jgi:hypothetical protein
MDHKIRYRLQIAAAFQHYWEDVFATNPLEWLQGFCSFWKYKRDLCEKALLWFQALEWSLRKTYMVLGMR